jgi:class 3 adenylate cyclase/tetratricopeptide (TPR) repeat protein
MDVTEWLRTVGLEQYAPAFRDNDIDAEVLARLTAEDLVQLGVTSIGHRRRLLDAMASFAKKQRTAEPSALSTRCSGPAADDERRQMTVMFCDLVGSTSLSTALDPEDLQEIIDAYHQCVAQTVARFEGFIFRCMGDGVVVLFGYPHSHEDDAERAVRSGLALIDAIAGVKAPNGLQLRVGIATGIVVFDHGDAHMRDVVGETPNLAARLQTIAEPNAVVIEHTTRAQIGGMFKLWELGPLRLKGFAESQRAWRVVAEGDILSRFEALRPQSTPLVGRAEELDLLLRRWGQAKAGEGRVVLISGEPGIGKSRMAAALSRAIQSEPHTQLRYFCSPSNQASALYPFIAHLERTAGWGREDTPDQKLAKLQAWLGPGARGDDEITLLAELLALPNSAGELNLTPQRKREKLFEALLRPFETATRTQPVLMVVEDAHWIDPTSRELLDITVDLVSRMPVLLVITFRPEFKHTWGGQPHMTELALNRLGERDVFALVERLAGYASLSPKTVDDIVQRSDGVPLFAEELTKAVLETGDPANPVTAGLPATMSPAPSIPATLHASLIARLDRLGSTAKEVAQIGAVLGREFGYDLIFHTAQRPAAQLIAGLERLGDAGLLFCRGVAPQSTYVFKHALVQDAAYATLLRTRRRELHSRVAAALEKDFVELIERQPEIFAHHLTAAGEAERAINQWLAAGQHAAARSAHLEAINHFDCGLAILATLPEGPDRDHREIELQLARGPSLFAAKGFAATEAPKAYARARHLAEKRGNARQLFTAVNGLWQSANGAGMVLECRKFSKGLQELAAYMADDALRLQAHHSAWATCLFSGEPAAARDHCEEGCRLYDPERHRLQHQLYGGHDPGACARYLGAQICWLLGHPEKGLALSRDGLVLADQSGHPFTLLCALQASSMLHLDRGEPELALQRLEAAETLAAEQRLGFAFEPQLLRGAALMALGKYESAVACLREGLVGQSGGATRFQCYGLAVLADALTQQGQHDSALAAVKDGLGTVEKTGHHQWKAELHRLEGIALFGLGRLEEGESALKQAISIARGQQAKAYELRAATSLARVWGERRGRVAARELLAPIYAWFSEGFYTADLKDAKTLLDQLA